MALINKEVIFNCSHDSMQFKDSPAQQESDMKKIFTRAESRDEWWVSGTEAGTGKGNLLREIIFDLAPTFGYQVGVREDIWIAVAKDIFSRNTLRFDHVPVLNSSDGLGKHTPRGIFYATWESPRLGDMALGCSHYLTRGARPGDPNYRFNKELTVKIGEWGRKYGAGRKLAFYAGDANSNDKKNDVFLGAPFTTLADELGKHQNTGHGPIDFIASWNHDGRVTGVDWNVLDDKEFHLFSDHWRGEGTFRAQYKQKVA